jgi:hypothetical protein
MTTKTTTRTDIYTRVTNQIVGQLERGIRALALALECRARRRQDQTAASAQRRALPRHQHPDAVPPIGGPRWDRSCNLLSRLK